MWFSRMVKNVDDNSCSSHGGGTNINSWCWETNNHYNRLQKVKCIGQKKLGMHIYIYALYVEVDYYKVEVTYGWRL